jgi:hypothetical protein
MSDDKSILNIAEYLSQLENVTYATTILEGQNKRFS